MKIQPLIKGYKLNWHMQNPELKINQTELTVNQEQALQVGIETERNLVLSERLVLELKRQGLYITSVESCTGGGLAYYITNIPGASDVMKDSFVTYSNEAKIALGVPKEIIDKYTVYSQETARAMAEAGLKRSIKADVSVGITGSISRADPTNSNSIPGVIYLAVRYKDKVISKELNISAERRFEVKQKIVEEVLKVILETIIN